MEAFPSNHINLLNMDIFHPTILVFLMESFHPTILIVLLKMGDVPSNRLVVFLGGLSDPQILPGSVDVSLIWGLKANDAMPLLGKAALAWHFQVPIITCAVEVHRKKTTGGSSKQISL